MVSSNTHDPAQKLGLPLPNYKELTELSHPDLKTFDYFRAYSSSKLLNVLFTYELNKKLPKNITANAYNPGWIPETELVRKQNFLVRLLFSYVLPWIVPKMHGGSTLSRSTSFLANLLDQPEFNGVTGKYFDIDSEQKSSEWSYDEERQVKLWNYSEELLEKLAK